MSLLSLAGFVLLATCSISFPVKETQETVICSDAMEMTAQEGGNTVFQFSGNVQVASDTFQATAQALTATLLGNPIEGNSSSQEAKPEPQLTQLQAEGEVHIHVCQPQEGDRSGSADRVEVKLVDDVFIFSGNAQIDQKGKGSIRGERIVLDRRQNRLQVEGDVPTSDMAKIQQRPSIKLEAAALRSEPRAEETATVPIAEDKNDPSPSLPPQGASPDTNFPVTGEVKITPPVVDTPSTATATVP
jgi:lipopolysaccharide export system protein LptA